MSENIDYDSIIHQKVVKANSLIQKKRYDLSLEEQKILAFVFSRIKSTDKELLPQTLYISDFCRMCGMKTVDYQFIKNKVKHLQEKSFWYSDTDKNMDILYGWIDTGTTIGYGTGTITFQLSPTLRPYLLNLKTHFTQYEVGYVLQMKSKYSIRLYELLKSYENIIDEDVKISMTRLRDILSCNDKYTQDKEFKRTVINKSIEEINIISDINVWTSTKYDSNREAYIVFTIFPKKKEKAEK